MSTSAQTQDEPGRDRSFTGFDNRPFISYDNITYTVRVDADEVVWLDYSDGRKVEACGVSAKRVLRCAAKGIWKEVTQ